MAIMRNQNSVAMVRYQTGGFAVGAEWLYSRTTFNKAITTAATVGVVKDQPAVIPGVPVSNTNAELFENNVLTGNQISLSFNYYF
jgi:hypothetical protein